MDALERITYWHHLVEISSACPSSTPRFIKPFDIFADAFSFEDGNKKDIVGSRAIKETQYKIKQQEWSSWNGNQSATYYIYISFQVVVIKV